MADPTNGSHDSLPDDDPILKALLERVKDPAMVRETVLGYYEARGIPRSNISGFEKFAEAVAPQTLSRVVTLPSGKRVLVLIDNATSESQLDEAVAEVLRTRT